MGNIFILNAYFAIVPRKKGDAIIFFLELVMQASKDKFSRVISMSSAVCR